MGTPGLERTRETKQNTRVSGTGDAKSDAIGPVSTGGAGFPGVSDSDTAPAPSPVPALSRSSDPDLGAIVAAWGTLSPATRRAVLAIVRAEQGGDGR